MTEQLGDLLRTISVTWSLLHVLVLFIFLYESRFSRKKTILLTVIFMAPLAIANVTLFAILGRETAASIMLLTITLPSLVFFYFMSKYRGSRFIFTFCLVDTVSLIVIILTGIIDAYLLGDTGIFTAVSRFLAFPLIEWFTFKRLHKSYALLQEAMHKSWGWFALTSACCYLLLAVLMVYPQNILEYPQNLPAMLIVCLLVPLIYYTILRSLQSQHRLHLISQHEAILRLEREHMEDILKQNSATEQRIRIERHDLRHRLKSIHSMLERGAYDEALTYIHASTSFLDTNQSVRYCQNPIVDAVFTSFFADAEANGIRIESSLAVPNELPVDATDFSIVMANALENAIRACKSLPEAERVIRCKYVIGPRHMCQISNPTHKEVLFDDNGRPITKEPGHGIGTHSIVAFCEKYHADLNYKYENGWFHIRIVL